jgi:hypothetical protein
MRDLLVEVPTESPDPGQLAGARICLDMCVRGQLQRRRLFPGTKVDRFAAGSGHKHSAASKVRERCHLGRAGMLNISAGYILNEYVRNSDQDVHTLQRAVQDHQAFATIHSVDLVSAHQKIQLALLRQEILRMLLGLADTVVRLTPKLCWAADGTSRIDEGRRVSRGGEWQCLWHLAEPLSP